MKTLVVEMMPHRSRYLVTDPAIVDCFERGAALSDCRWFDAEDLDFAGRLVRINPKFIIVAYMAFVCDECGNGYSTSQRLSEHRSDVHHVEESAA